MTVTRAQLTALIAKRQRAGQMGKSHEDFLDCARGFANHNRPGEATPADRQTEHDRDHAEFLDALRGFRTVNEPGTHTQADREAEHDR